MTSLSKSYYESSKGKQIYINLSPFAYSIIQSDLSSFSQDTKNLATLINRIFENYQESAQANIAKRLDDERAFLQEPDLDANPDRNIELSNETIKKILLKREKILLSEKVNYEKGNSFRIYLQNSNADLLSSQFSNKKYYAKPRDYLKQVIEEYASKPYWEREKIFFSKGYIKQINDAISSKRRLKIVTGNREFFVFPYTITQDPMFMYNYLIGYSSPLLNAPKSMMTACSFRISAISELKTLPAAYKASLTKEEEAKLKKNLSTHNIQFMLDDVLEIKVKFTPQGERMYRRNLYLKPNEFISSKINPNKSDSIYVFYCTETQAEYYFFKFGADAVILSPASLRNKILQKHESALAAYKSIQN